VLAVPRAEPSRLESNSERHHLVLRADVRRWYAAHEPRRTIPIALPRGRNCSHATRLNVRALVRQKHAGSISGVFGASINLAPLTRAKVGNFQSAARAEPPYRVFVNGVPQATEGLDYELTLSDASIPHPRERRQARGRFAGRGDLPGLFGTYRKNDSVTCSLQSRWSDRIAVALDNHSAEGTEGSPRNLSRLRIDEILY